MNKQWIDPPNGWRYGFPQIWYSEKHPDIREWLLISGYPRDDVDFALHYCRMWPAEDFQEPNICEEPETPQPLIKSDALNEMTEVFQEWEESFVQERETFWNTLDRDEQLLAFCEVISRLTKAELVDKKSYRGVLYDAFDFGMESYVCAQISGFLDLHNAIVRKDDV